MHYYDCDVCGVTFDSGYSHYQQQAPETSEAHYCPDCQAEIDEHNAVYQPKPAPINWRQFFGVEDETSTLNTFYSGVEA